MVEFEIILKKTAIADLDALRRFDVVQIADAMEKYLQHEPAKESRSRIKRLQGIDDPDYRLRVGAYRIFYTVVEDAQTVTVLRVMHKEQTAAYYEELEQ